MGRRRKQSTASLAIKFLCVVVAYLAISRCPQESGEAVVKYGERRGQPFMDAMKPVIDRMSSGTSSSVADD